MLKVLVLNGFVYFPIKSSQMWVINLKKQFVNEDQGICHVVLLHEISEMHSSLADRTLILMCGTGSFPLGLVLVPPTTCWELPRSSSGAVPQQGFWQVMFGYPRRLLCAQAASLVAP